MCRLLMWVVTIVTGDDLDVVLVLVEAAFPDPFLLVAPGAHSDDLTCRSFPGIEDESLTAGLYVLTTGTMTHLTPFVRRCVFRTVDGGEVCRPGVPGVLIGMAGAASRRADEAFRAGRLLDLRGW